jgi:mannose-6-phosphate isomerase-like protein (cupin superfamily)
VLDAACMLAVGCASAAPCSERARADQPRAELHYQLITLAPESVEQALLDGPPQTAGMRSGRVVLKPGEHMHRHSTHGNEELLVFLLGKARVVLGSETITAQAGQVLFIPPHTEHELHNDGPVELRYIYTVAPAAP